jgi:NADH-quinone oxidoreductase subunit G
MATIEIDGKVIDAQPGTMIIEVADRAQISIPRFCYHKDLSIAANCRMCLVEVANAPKPMPACATPVTDGMKIFTRSEKALLAQRAVMEFLLINHPLDCPVCDQGGECELQDISMGYGSVTSYYEESKRAVQDKNIGPLVQTELTRCILCTRCVRFGEEIAGLKELGVVGRGEHVEIATFVESSMVSELSGNVIDLCPVGALTAKPSRFTARAWELRQHEGVSPHDAVGSNLYLHTLGGKICRVVPRENRSVNDIWLSDRDRFSYQGLNHPERLQHPMMKIRGHWQAVSWETALQAVVDISLSHQAVDGRAASLGGLISSQSTLEELFLFQKLLRRLGSDHIDHRLFEQDFSLQHEAPLYPGFSKMALKDIAEKDVLVILGAFPRDSQPLLNYRIRKAVLSGTRVVVLNPVPYDWNYELSYEAIVAPNELLITVAGIAKALGQALAPEHPYLHALKNIRLTPAAVKIADVLRAGQRPALIFGHWITAHPQASLMRDLIYWMAGLLQCGTLALTHGPNAAGAWLAGAVPHRTAGGRPVQVPGLTVQEMLRDSKLKAMFLFGLEPELDAVYGYQLLARLSQMEKVICFSSYVTPIMQSYAHVILPIAPWSETSGTFVDFRGQWQSFEAAVPAHAEARPGWKVLVALAQLCGCVDFDYAASIDIKKAVSVEIDLYSGEYALPVDRDPAHCLLIGGDPLLHAGSVVCLSQQHPYHADPIVRRAAALQKTPLALHSRSVSIGSGLARALDVETGDWVKLQQFDASVIVPVRVDGRLPHNVASVWGGAVETCSVAACYQPIHITKEVGHD